MRVNQTLTRYRTRHEVLAGKRTITRQEERTEATRRKLLAAAETIFARDGFEAARLEDIASLAGYTRGAFYANFRSKEDIFFALLEPGSAGGSAEVTSLLVSRKVLRNVCRALREHYAQIAQDRGLALLSLEFKLFAIRHPEAHARLRTRQRRFRACGADLLTGIAKSWAARFPFRAQPPPPDLAHCQMPCCSNILSISRRISEREFAISSEFYSTPSSETKPQNNFRRHRSLNCVRWRLSATSASRVNRFVAK